MKKNLLPLLKFSFSKILINRSKHFSLVLLSDVENGTGLIPDSKKHFEAQASIQSIHNTKHHCTLIHNLIHKTIYASEEVVSNVPTNTVEMDDIVVNLTLSQKKKKTRIVAPASGVVALTLSNNRSAKVSKEVISTYIEEIFLGEVMGMQGINADSIWLELDEDVEVKICPPKLGKLLKNIREIDKLIFFFEGRPHWRGKQLPYI